MRNGDQMTPDLTAELATTRLLAVIRGTDTAAAVATGSALLAAGVRVVEVALTTPDACDAIAA
ncbi:aldolase, partial [Micromonospora zhanjiangensis]